MSRILIFALLVLAVTSFDLCSENVQELNAQSDSYQWPQYFQDLLLENQYHEWWFFTFFDEQNDIGMAFSYGLTNPKNASAGSCGITNMVWSNVISEEIQKPNMLISDFHISECQLSQENAYYSSPAGGITVVSPDGKTYNVKMSLNNLTLDLNYTQLVSPCRQTEDFAPIVVLDWQSYMISARVEGTIVYNNITYNITAKGYHDKNWGAWPSSKFNWIWSQYNDPTQGLGIVLGSYKLPVIDKYIGYLFLRVENANHTIIKKLGTLCLDDWSLNVIQNATDDYGKTYASHIQIQVKQLIFGSLKVVIDIQKKVAYQNPGGIALDLIVFEMISYYNVQIYDGDNLILNSEGYGFNEWSELTNS